MRECADDMTDGDEVGEDPCEASAGEGEELTVAVGEALWRYWRVTTSTAVPSDRGRSRAS
jgi:hypothetical protein